MNKWIWINPSPLRILFPWIVWKNLSGDKKISLTFDDGPHPENTPVILDCLADKQVKATFFLSGENVLSNPGLVRRLYAEGHMIGNHSFSHTSLAFKNRRFVMDEISKTDRAIEQIIGHKPTLFRPPYGHFDFQLKRLMRETGHRPVLWSLSTCDFRETDSEKLVTRVKRHLHAGAILLLHDGHKNTGITIESLPHLIETVHRSGFKFAGPEK